MEDKRKAELANQFNDLCRPIREFIENNFDDYTTVIITKNSGKLCLDEFQNGSSNAINLISPTIKGAQALSTEDLIKSISDGLPNIAKAGVINESSRSKN